MEIIVPSSVISADTVTSSMAFGYGGLIVMLSITGKEVTDNTCVFSA